jgi:hypothetical protein
MAWKFVSKYPFLKVNVAAEEVAMSPDGRRIVTRSPQYAIFRYGEFITQRKETVKLLVDHPAYNRTFFGPYDIEAIKEGKAAIPKEADIQKIVAQAKRKGRGPEIKTGITGTVDGSKTVKGDVITREQIQKDFEKKIMQEKSID